MNQVDGYLCSYIDVDGPDVGVTCEIFADGVASPTGFEPVLPP